MRLGSFAGILLAFDGCSLKSNINTEAINLTPGMCRTQYQQCLNQIRINKNIRRKVLREKQSLYDVITYNPFEVKIKGKRQRRMNDF